MSAHQADLFRSARARRDVGIARAGEHADRVSAEWRERAAQIILAYAEHVQGAAFLIEDAGTFATSRGLPSPPDNRSWGAAVRLAKARGYIVGAGYAPARTSNCSPKCAWRLA